MSRLEPAQPIEVGLGELGFLSHLPVDHRDLKDDARLFTLFRAASAKLIFVERHQVVPLLGLREVLGEKAHRLGVAGPEVEHAFVGRHGAVFGLELARQDAPEPIERNGALFLRCRFRRARLEKPRDLLPSLLPSVDPLEQVRDARVFRVELESVLEAPRDLAERFLRSISVAVSDFRCAHQERALERRVGCLLGLFEVALDELLPLLALGLAALDGFFGRRIRGADLEKALVGPRRALVVEELVFEHARELELHRELDGRSRVKARFELEQLRDGVPLAARLVTAARGFEQRAKVGRCHCAVGRCHRLEELVPRIFFVRIVLELAKCRSDLLRAHHHPENVASVSNGRPSLFQVKTRSYRSRRDPRHSDRPCYAAGQGDTSSACSQNRVN